MSAEYEAAMKEQTEQRERELEFLQTGEQETTKTVP